MNFRRSSPLTVGVELELMLIDPDTGELVSASQLLLGQLHQVGFARTARAEITQSMLELNSGVHDSVAGLGEDLRSTCAQVVAMAESLRIAVCGGGAHPYRSWEKRRIYPAERFTRLQDAFGYLARQFTVFGLHVHIGVTGGDEAIRLAHALNRYVPHLIALSASSPLQRGVDTDFQSSRINVISVFPLSGHLPPVQDWREFTAYFQRLRDADVVESMKDFYWDVRPKPELGTVEVRAADMPLGLEQVLNLAAFVQALAGYCLATTGPTDLSRLYEAYAVNRFAAARFGLQATLVDLAAGSRAAIAGEVTDLLEAIGPYAVGAAAAARLRTLQGRVARGETDAAWVRERFQQLGDCQRLMKEQAARLPEPAA